LNGFRPGANTHTGPENDQKTARGRFAIRNPAELFRSAGCRDFGPADNASFGERATAGQ
jgi:hypothetical protein